MPLEKEYNYFLKNKEALLKKYENKFIVIVDEGVVGGFDTQEAALRYASKEYKLGTFLIQRVSMDEEDISQKFYSMVYF